MYQKQLPDRIPIAQSVLNNFPSPHRGNFYLLTAFMGRYPNAPVNTCIRSTTATLLTITDAQLESDLNSEDVVKLCAYMHPRVQSALVAHRKKSRETASEGPLPNFIEGGYLLVARSDSHVGDKLFFRLGGPISVRKALNDFFYHVADIGNAQ